jgi:dTDP-4-amino-4,6-dideoxygalactose transaminase
LATQARDKAPYYQHSRIGYNYRMSNICAGIGRGQMTVLNERVKMRRRVFETYKQALENVPGLSFQNEPDGSYSNRWLTTILLNPAQSPNAVTNEIIRIALEEDNIESRPLWKPMHLQPVFKDVPFYGNGVCDDLFQKGLCLPSGSNLTEEESDRVIQKVLYLFN